MKSEELMIGDWVMYNPNVFIEDEYEPTKECFPTKINSGEDIDLAIEGCYIPIPLTPEILEKNGFSGEMYAFCKINDEQWLEYYYHEHRLRKWWRGIDERNNHAEVNEITFQCNCYYVHELQHALRLCGTSKTIEL